MGQNGTVGNQTLPKTGQSGTDLHRGTKLYRIESNRLEQKEPSGMGRVGAEHGGKKFDGGGGSGCGSGGFDANVAVQ